MPKKLTIFLILLGLFFSAESRADFSDGDLVKGSGPEVYVIEHGAKRWIPNPDIFQKLFYDWKKILVVSNSVLSGIPPGNKLENGDNYPDGALIRAAKKKEIYVIDQGKRRWIPNPDIFYSNNFSPGKIIAVNDEKIKSIERGADVKSGEFLLLPETYLTEKPAAEINFTKVNFRFSGVNPSGPVSELSWETFLEGYDDRWQRTSDYTRTVDLPGVSKPYKFYVRSRDKNGKVDPSPAAYSFKVIGFSPFYGKLRIDGVRGGGNGTMDEYVRIANSSQENVDITGLILKNKNREIGRIPEGTELFYLEGSNYNSDIILSPGQSATIFGGISPVGKNFRRNKCTGYLNYYNPPVSFPRECPKPTGQSVSGLSKNCVDYINGLGTCAVPDFNTLAIVYDEQCKKYLADNFSYNGCLNNYRSDPDFAKNEWYAFLGSSQEILDNRSDDVKLSDKDGNLINSYSY